MKAHISASTDVIAGFNEESAVQKVVYYCSRDGLGFVLLLFTFFSSCFILIFKIR